ncbi:endonuclease/exonuclease/phosphatase family protein [Streptomyces sp. bgisy082]|uniref:endonuclease/exonuclease/phosphatase family protein n=1 Tax=Streptomyces sp. bgisy082 TaxID=3413776 RepID=UPI003D72B6FC
MTLATPLRALRRALTVGAAALLATAGLAPTAARADVVTPSTAPSVRMLTYNACGNVCAHEGVTAAQWAATVKTSMDNWSADTLLLTEACYGQYAALRDSLTGYQPVWLATSSGPAGCGKWTATGDKRFGMAVFVKSTAPVERLTADLPENPVDSNKRALLCARGGVEGRTALACVTHLTHKGDRDENDEDLLNTARIQQARAVRARVDAWSLPGNLPVILGGDFNAHPGEPEMGEFYGFQGGTGRYGEVDETDEDRFPTGCAGLNYCRSGESTHDNGKLDYIFVSADHFKTVQGDAMGRTANMSDHHLLRGAAAWE